LQDVNNILLLQSEGILLPKMGRKRKRKGKRGGEGKKSSLADLNTNFPTQEDMSLMCVVREPIQSEV